MDSRYKERGYSAEFLEAEHGAYLSISRKGKIVGEVAVGFFSGGPDAQAQILIKRFQPNELREVQTADDFVTE